MFCFVGGFFWVLFDEVVFCSDIGEFDVWMNFVFDGIVGLYCEFEVSVFIVWNFFVLV